MNFNQFPTKYRYGSGRLSVLCIKSRPGVGTARPEVWATDYLRAAAAVAAAVAAAALARPRCSSKARLTQFRV